MNDKKYSIEDEVEITDFRKDSNENQVKKTIQIEENNDIVENLKDSLSTNEEELIEDDIYSKSTHQEESENHNESIVNELNEYKDKYIRLLAELENHRKRAEKIQKETAIYSVTDFAKNLLPIIDIFYKAMSHIDINTIQDNNFKNFAVGIDMTHKEFIKVLNKFNIKEIDTNTPFNPNIHDALYFKQDASKENNFICEVIEMGYMIEQRLLRPAKVGIIKNN
jgi:molecular chaperone GrpE